MALATFTITNDGQFLLTTSTETGSVESLSLTEIKDITCTTVAPMVGTYPYVDMNKITVETNGRSADLTFDLAAVTNQPTWTLDQAGCIKAQADIRGWAAGSSSSSVVKTAALTVVSGVSTGALAGLSSVTFFNQGPVDATVAGGILSAGESVSFDAGQSNTLGTVNYTTIATGVLKISTVV